MIESSTPRPDQPQIRFTGTARLVIIVALVIATIWFLGKLGMVVIPFILAILLAYILNPIVGLLTRRTHWPRLVFVVGFFALLVAFVAWLVSIVPLAMRQFGEIRRNLPVYLDDLRRTAAGFGLNIDEPTYDTIKRTVVEFKFGAGAQMAEIARGAFESFLLTLVFVAASFFFLLDAERIGERIRNAVPRRFRAEVLPLIGQINGTISGWIRGQLVLVVVMSVASYIALSILGIHFALFIAIATGFLETIPYLGPYSAGGLAVFVALVQPQTNFGWSNVTMAVVVAVVYTTLRHLEDYLIVPYVMGKSVHLHPMLVLFAAFAGSSVAGVLGLFLAVPVIAIVKLILEFVVPRLFPPESEFEVEVAAEGQALRAAVERANEPPSKPGRSLQDSTAQ